MAPRHTRVRAWRPRPQVGSQRSQRSRLPSPGTWPSCGKGSPRRPTEAPSPQGALCAPGRPRHSRSKHLSQRTRLLDRSHPPHQPRHGRALHPGRWWGPGEGCVRLPLSAPPPPLSRAPATGSEAGGVRPKSPLSPQPPRPGAGNAGSQLFTCVCPALPPAGTVVGRMWGGGDTFFLGSQKLHLPPSSGSLEEGVLDPSRLDSRFQSLLRSPFSPLPPTPAGHGPLGVGGAPPPPAELSSPMEVISSVWPPPHVRLQKD